MTSISDLPPFALDQILGRRDTSYVIIKLWLCGDFKLQSKLATGLTFLELKNHPFGTCLVPAVISHLRSLRHLSLDSPSKLAKDSSDWSEILRSWPNSLESLSIRSTDNWQHCLWQPSATHYTRGVSRAIEFETLFPRLQTLAFPSHNDTRPHFIAASLFAALPSSLTVLDAPIMFTAPFEPLSSLPPTIRSVRASWDLGLVSLTDPNRNHLDVDNALDELRASFASAPHTLETFQVGFGNLHFKVQLTIPPTVWAKSSELETNSEHYWLPKSLLEVDWTETGTPTWTPSIARTMPSTLQSLRLCYVNSFLFRSAGSNWVAELPKSLKTLHVEDSNHTDLVSHIHMLPRGLTEISLQSLNDYNKGIFGDWSTIPGANCWPSNLTKLDLHQFFLEPSEIIHLPQTVTNLRIVVDSDTRAAEKPVLQTKLLPAALIVLDLSWGENVTLSLSLERFNLQSCALCFEGDELYLFHPSPFKHLPKSLETLLLGFIDLDSAHKPYSTPEIDLPNLKTLTVCRANRDWFEFFPRSLEDFKIQDLEVESPFTDDVQLFKHLPASLVFLEIIGAMGYAKLPTQDLAHLTSLRSLHLSYDWILSSDQIRYLPPTLTKLDMCDLKPSDEDLRFLPKHLKSWRLDNLTPALVECLPIAALSSFAMLSYHGFPYDLREIVIERVRQAAVYQ